MIIGAITVSETGKTITAITLSRRQHIILLMTSRGAASDHRAVHDHLPASLRDYFHFFFSEKIIDIGMYIRFHIDADILIELNLVQPLGYMYQLDKN